MSIARVERKELLFFKEMRIFVKFFQGILLWVALLVSITTGMLKGFHLIGKCSLGNPKNPQKMK
jgi:hypothetical protein